MLEKYRLLIENLPDAYAYQQLITDSEGNFVDYVFLDINTAFTEMTGLPRTSVLNKKVTEVLPGIKEAAFDWIGTYGKVALSGETVRFEQYFEPLNRWYEVTAYSDAPGYFAVIFRNIAAKSGFERNIAERKHNEEQSEGISQLPQRQGDMGLLDAFHSVLECNEFEQTARHIFENCCKTIGAVSGYVALLSADGTENEVLFLEAGGLACKVDPQLPMPIRGLRAEAYNKAAVIYENDFMKSKWIKFMPPGHVNLRNVMFIPLMVRNKAVGVIGLANKPTDFTEDDAKLAAPYGDIASIALIRTRDMELLARTSELLQQEINEHRQTEKTLLESEERYRTLVNNANETILVIQKGIIKYANPKATEMFGCLAEELTAAPYLDFIHPDDRHIILDRRKRRQRGEVVNKPYTVRLMAADGRLKYIAKSTASIKWEGCDAVLSLIIDITEIKLMEAEIFKAEKLNSIGVFAGGIAHDLNNYLAVLLANASLAKLYTNNPQKVQEKLENMEQATLRAKELSNQLFTFAKGAVPVKKTVSLNQSIIDNINFILSGSNIKCDYSIAENLHHVETDEDQFSQVLNNIALNAVQAMPEGGTIRVTADNFINKEGNGASFLPLPEGNYIKVTIQDKGIGIPEKHLQKIFDPFFTTKQKGSGLGLATSYTIMQNHGGHISVTSKTGVGTTFHLYLPASTKTVTVNTATENVVCGRGRILVMDDQEDYLTVTGEILATLGYEASVARDGREAITIYMEALTKGQPFDLVIMDLTIPGGMGGKDTIKELLQKDPEVKAIVASGYSNDPIMGDFGDYGFKGVLKKPFVLAELSKLVFAIIG